MSIEPHLRHAVGDLDIVTENKKMLAVLKRSQTIQIIEHILQYHCNYLDIDATHKDNDAKQICAYECRCNSNLHNKNKCSPNIHPQKNNLAYATKQ